jgi:hypothetical protein
MTPVSTGMVKRPICASVFTTTGSSISSRSRTAAVTGDTATNIGTGSYRTVNVTAQVDEVTTRAGWASGNNIALIADASAAADIWILSYDSGSGIWYVEIDYTAGRFTRTVSASGDDGAESTGGSMTLTTTTMDTDSVGDIMGFMFRGVQVPTGSSITTAYLKVYTNDSGRDSVRTSRLRRNTTRPRLARPVAISAAER